MSPLTIPTIILAIGALSIASLTIGSPNVGVLIAIHIVIAIPYVMRTVTGVMTRADHFTEEAARTLGASTWNRYRLVVLPIARPGIAAGAFFAFNISFDDAVIALFLRTPQLETLPIAIYGQLEFSTSPTVAAVSTLMVPAHRRPHDRARTHHRPGKVVRLMTTLTITSLTKDFKGTKVLKGIDLSMQSGSSSPSSAPRAAERRPSCAASPASNPRAAAARSRSRVRM